MNLPEIVFDNPGFHWQNAVVHHPHLKQGNVHVRPGTSGEITLHGTVRSYYEKQMAQEVFRNVDGVLLVRNELSVIKR